jgi:hypothetical protein
MKYQKLEREEFDAIVTGEMTHYALWFEDQLEALITLYFVDDPNVIELFEATFIRSRHFSLSQKLEFTKKLLRQWSDSKRSSEFKAVIEEVETLIAIRNTMAHGRDIGGTGLELLIEIQSYGGKTKEISITPETHEAAMATAERCLTKLKELKWHARALRQSAK